MILLSDHELETLLAEDVPYGDLTTKSLGIDTQHARITFATRERPLVVSCMEEAVRLCGLYGLEIDGFVKSGTLILPKFFPAEEAFAQALNRAKKANPEKKIVTSSPYSAQPADIKVAIVPL